MTFDKDKFTDADFSTAEDNVLKKFYIPALRESVRYDGAIGFFTTHGLLKVLQGIEGLVKNKGRMRLVIGKPLKDDEYNALNDTGNTELILSEWKEEWTKLFNQDHSEVNRYRLEIFSWLFNNKYLEIQYAIRRRGMYHKKIGILKDEEGTIITFAGSINFTDNALSAHEDEPMGSSEQFDVFPSWEETEFKRHGESKIKQFERVWTNTESNTKTLKIPSDHYKVIQDYFTKHEPPKSKIEQKTAELFDLLYGGTGGGTPPVDYPPISLDPIFPKKINGQDYKLHEHQNDALSEWKANDYKGIFALATGSGKTITAIHSSVAISKTGGGDLAVIVSVPYIVLADQWCEVFKLYNINPIKCYISTNKWRKELGKEIANFNLIPSKKFLALVVVNKTLVSDQFQDEIKKIEKDKLLFIGDECHHHASEDTIKKLPDARYTMGLSATPWTEEGENKDLLSKYYSRIVARYSIDRAIREKVLVGYNYHLNKVDMSGEEYVDYDEKTQEINKLVAIKYGGGNINQNRLMTLSMERSRILGSLEDKFNKIEELLTKRKVAGKNTLFYCGDGSVELNDEELTRDVERLAEILEEKGWKTSRFTAEETHATRIGILNNLKTNYVDAIVAIRVLDEGFDVPQCEEAFLIASSRNSRQFIQRRGRVLRTSPDTGKTKAEIQDFIVLPGNNSKKTSIELVKKELARVYEFSRVALNKRDLENEMSSIANDYKLDINTIIKEEDEKRKKCYD